MSMEMPGDSANRNSSIWQSNVILSIVSSSHVVKGTLIALVAFYFLSFSSSAFDHLCVVPGYVLPPNFWIWTLFTHSFLQAHIVLVAVDFCVVLLSGKLLEPVWGPLQIGIFFAVVTSVAALSTALIYMILYYISGNTVYLFETHIHGLGAYIGGFCVAVKQLMPDEILLRLPFGKVRNKHIPLMCMTSAVVLSLLGVLNGPYAIHFAFGVLVSWIYLRFYQRHSNGNKGDMGEEFSFASFFPQPIELVVAVISNTIFSLLIRVKVCEKPQRKYDVSSPATITVTLPGTDPADAERRRQLAIKALNERLSKASEEASWPGLEDEDEAESGATPTEVVVISSDSSSTKPDSVSVTVSETGGSVSQPVNPANAAVNS